ncbi:hypothetical protein M422DRAFT_153140 [Sphaerobolus stellatus SS14]|nr:hypothetical protein M422DRAFT_153140 [Sphaerobolus stellatus SS14]
MITRRSTRANLTQPNVEGSERTTRSAAMGARPRLNFQPKLKLKVNERQAGGMSFLGPYDRELDSDDEDLAFEEQFILRMPPGEDCDKLREMVEKREMSKDVYFKFKGNILTIDSRRGIFHIGNNTYSAKLVDLPCVVESNKTLDNKNLFKVADICQMLVVEDKIQNEDEVLKRSFNLDDFIYPHGITPPLHWVRKRRFRKRVNRRTIETVEQEVERLLAEDSQSQRVEYVVLDNVNPDLSDSEFIEPEGTGMEEEEEMRDEMEPATPAQVAGEEGEEGEDEGDEEDEDEEEGDIDEELAAELAREMGEDMEEQEEEEEEGSESESDEDDDEEEDEEAAEARKLLLEEIRDLEAAISRKESEISASVNPIIKKRFEDQLRKMKTDLEQKQAQRGQLMAEKQRKKMVEEKGAVQPVIEEEPEEADEDGGGLFGSDEDEDMEEVTENIG